MFSVRFRPFRTQMQFLIRCYKNGSNLPDNKKKPQDILKSMKKAQKDLEDLGKMIESMLIVQDKIKAEIKETEERMQKLGNVAAEKPKKDRSSV